MEFYGKSDESIDLFYKKAFEIDRTLSLEEADNKWIEYVKYTEKTIKRRNERFESMMISINTVERFFQEIPKELLDISTYMLTISGKTISRDKITQELRQTNIKILLDTKKLYRECTIKLHDLTRRKFTYGLWNRSNTRSDLPEEYKISKKSISVYLESLILSLTTYQNTIIHYENKIKSNEKNKELRDLTNVYKDIIKFYEEEIQILNKEIEYYYVLRGSVN